MSSPGYFLAHDLGTTGDKATLVAEDGRLVGSVTVPYATDFGSDGRAEQDPEDWWRAFCEANARLLADCDVAASRVRSVSFSGQMMGAVLLDGGGTPVRPAIIWADTRARDQCDRLIDAVGMDGVYTSTGHRANPTYSVPKMMWVRDHEPATFERVEHVVTAKDYLLLKLTGRFVTDPSDASGTNGYDQLAQRWDHRILQAADLPVSIFPEIVASTTDLGTPSRAVLEQSGLDAGTRIVVGGGDGPMGALGAGIVDESSGLYTYLGSSSWVSFASRSPLHDPQMRSMTFNHVLPDRFVPTATMQAGGASLDWVVSALLGTDQDRYDVLLAEAAEVEASADGLYFLPYLMGERSPHWNPRARGTFVGLTITHRRAHLVRAVIEGVAMNLRTGLVAFAESGHAFDSADAIGGASKSALVQQVLADFWQLPIVPSPIGDHATALGAAAVAALGVGALDESGVPEFVRQDRGEPTVPRLPVAERDERYARFDDAYRRLEPWFEGA